MERHASFAIEDTERVVGDKRALLVGPIFSPALACLWLLIAIFASTVAGIAAGVVSHSAAQGVGFGSGLLAIFTTIQAMMVWRIRS